LYDAEAGVWTGDGKFRSSVWIIGNKHFVGREVGGAFGIVGGYYATDGGVHVIGNAIGRMNEGVEEMISREELIFTGHLFRKIL
jgi:hypothetical protein